MKAFLVGLWVSTETEPRAHPSESIVNPFPAGDEHLKEGW